MIAPMTRPVRLDPEAIRFGKVREGLPSGV